MFAVSSSSGAFSLDLRNKIFAGAIYKDLKPNTYVMRQGEEGDFMACVMSGRLRMSITCREGREMLVTMVERGELFGEMSILDGQPRALDVITETECTLMIIKKDDFIPILRSSPDAMMGLLNMTCYRMRLYLKTLELVSLQNLPVRLGRYLIRLATDYGKEVEGRLVISARLSQMDMAHQLACSRESINKQMSVFAEMNLLAMENENIILLDIEGLKRAIAPV